MIAYIDASVLMRIVLNAPNQLQEWPELDDGVSSRLLKTEAFRALDQLWHRGELTEIDLSTIPTTLGTLDALHLATAIRYRAEQTDDERPIFFATHDVPLARAARAMNFEVLGA